MRISLPLLILSNLSESLILRSFPATLLVLFPATASSVQSHIILIYNIYSIIDIPLNTVKVTFIFMVLSVLLILSIFIKRGKNEEIFNIHLLF